MIVSSEDQRSRRWRRAILWLPTSRGPLALTDLASRELTFGSTITSRVEQGGEASHRRISHRTRITLEVDGWQCGDNHNLTCVHVEAAESFALMAAFAEPLVMLHAELDAPVTGDRILRLCQATHDLIKSHDTAADFGASWPRAESVVEQPAGLMRVTTEIVPLALDGGLVRCRTLLAGRVLKAATVVRVGRRYVCTCTAGVYGQGCVHAAVGQHLALRLRLLRWVIALTGRLPAAMQARYQHLHQAARHELAALWSPTAATEPRPQILRAA